MPRGFRARSEAARALQDDVDAELGPGEQRWIGLLEHRDPVPADADETVARLDLLAEASVDGVVLEQMRQRGCIHEVVDRDALEIGVALVGRAQRSPAHSAEAVDCDSSGHCLLLSIDLLTAASLLLARAPSAVPRNPVRKGRRPNQAVPR